MLAKSFGLAWGRTFDVLKRKWSQKLNDLLKNSMMVQCCPDWPQKEQHCQTINPQSPNQCNLETTWLWLWHGFGSLRSWDVLHDGWQRLWSLSEKCVSLIIIPLLLLSLWGHVFTSRTKLFWLFLVTLVHTVKKNTKNKKKNKNIVKASLTSITLHVNQTV